MRADELRNHLYTELLASLTVAHTGADPEAVLLRLWPRVWASLQAHEAAGHRDLTDTRMWAGDESVLDLIRCWQCHKRVVREGHAICDICVATAASV